MLHPQLSLPQRPNALLVLQLRRSPVRVNRLLKRAVVADLNWELATVDLKIADKGQDARVVLQRCEEK